MRLKNKEFINKTREACENSDARKILLHNLRNYSSKFKNGISQFSDYQEARKKLHYFKYKTIESIEKNLTDFETNFNKRGGKVIYASEASDALKYILEIIKQTGTTKIVKSKSMVCEEIHLEEFLAEQGIKTLETDLGEFIVQLAGEPPSHITAPALHKSASDIYNLLNEKFNQSFYSSTPVEVVVNFVRKILRKEYSEAGVGITGCNFLVADIGAVAVSENEANAILSASVPPVHIVVTSIDKVISNLANLELFQSMLASHGTGQKLTAYNHLFFGSDKKDNVGQYEKIHVIIIDNNRTELLKNITLRESCYCIKCGACHNVCPIYKHIGGHTYNSVYNGPIGSVISPIIFGGELYSHLPFASTLCGKCNEICPVKINLTGLLIQSRNEITVHKMNSRTERFILKKSHYFLLKRSRMDGVPNLIKNMTIRFVLKKNWGLQREIPIFEKNSYNSKIKNKEN